MTKNQKIWTTVIVVVLAVFIGWRAYENSRQSSGTIKIGAVLPMTGWGAYWTEGEMKGIELARHDIAAQGGSVEIDVEDGNTDATKSATAAEKLISVDGVSGMFVEFTGASTAVAPIAAQNKIPMIYDALASFAAPIESLCIQVLF